MNKLQVLQRASSCLYKVKQQPSKSEKLLQVSFMPPHSTLPTGKVQMQMEAHRERFSIAAALLEPSVQAANPLYTWVVRKANEPVSLGLG